MTKKIFVSLVVENEWMVTWAFDSGKNTERVRERLINAFQL